MAVAALDGAAQSRRCDRYAAPDGSDRAPGTRDRPYRTVRRLVAGLRRGRVGCLREGTYRGDVTIRRGGRQGARLILRSHPGERARIVGRIVVARTAPWVTVSDLDLDGRNGRRLPSPTINSAHASFLRNDVTNRHTGICFLLGGSYGTAREALLRDNRVHDCGRLPAANQDHGVYVAVSRDSRITRNLIYDNADRGVQLYPDAQRTLIDGNVIDGNGEGIIFSGADGVASNDNLVTGNVISNSRERHNVESYYPSGNPEGRGNVVRGNCLWNGRQGDVQDPQVGFTASDNVVADPRFADRDGGDFTVHPDSPCAGVLGR